MDLMVNPHPRAHAFGPGHSDKAFCRDLRERIYE
jgi:hypothetical protein